MNSNKLGWRRIVLCILSSFLILGCSEDVSLSNGYKLVRIPHVPSDYHVIVDRDNNYAIAENITLWNKNGDLIYGFVESVEAPPGMENWNNWSVGGYFVLQTKTGEKHVGLNESAWTELLRRFGVTKGTGLIHLNQ